MKKIFLSLTAVVLAALAVSAQDKVTKAVMEIGRAHV